MDQTVQKPPLQSVREFISGSVHAVFSLVWPAYRSASTSIDSASAVLMHFHPSGFDVVVSYDVTSNAKDTSDIQNPNQEKKSALL